VFTLLVRTLLSSQIKCIYHTHVRTDRQTDRQTDLGYVRAPLEQTLRHVHAMVVPRVCKSHHLPYKKIQFLREFIKKSKHLIYILSILEVCQNSSRYVAFLDLEFYLFCRSALFSSSSFFPRPEYFPPFHHLPGLVHMTRLT
jgi:hypothetical protein